MGHQSNSTTYLALAILLLLPCGNVAQLFGFFGGGTPQGSRNAASSSGNFIGGLIGGLIGNSRGRTINAVSYSLPTPPVLRGATAANNDLVNAEKVHNGLVTGPGSFVNYQGNLYAATNDHKIVNLAKCKPDVIADLAPTNCAQTTKCAQLTSLRRDPSTGDLIALDTFRGVYRINITDGSFEQIYNVKTPINGRVPVHLNDMVIFPNGIIMMTDSSDAHEFGADVYIGMEGRKSGRLILFAPSNGVIRELLPKTFVFPNGLEITPDGNSLLLAETGRARIQRISLQRSSWLRVTPFSSNLPGLPDNIRASDHGTYWVGMSFARHSTSKNPMDSYSRNSYYRTMGASRMAYSELKDMFSTWGMAVELDSFGNIIRSLHDPTGRTMSMVSEINEFGGVLNIGSPEINYMGRMVVPGRPFKLDSFMEIVVSRCKIPESKIEETRQKLYNDYFNKNKKAGSATNKA